jgi:type I restriction enzyme M protein
MLDRVRDEVFPLIKNLGHGTEGAYSRFLSDAVFMITSASLLDRVVKMLDGIQMADRDTKGDLYEYMLGKIATAGQNGQFRTPRHIIKMMVDVMAPTPQDSIADPACGTCGFLIAAAEYMEDNHTEALMDPEVRAYYNQEMFHGADFDATMLRIGAMNMMLHGIEQPEINSFDSLSANSSEVRGKYSLILANPPFKGSLNYDEAADDLLQVARTKKTELLFVALFLEQLQIGGRCACIVPDGVLFGSSKAHKSIRKAIIDDHKLDGIIDMPSGVFKPYAGVSTAIMVFTKTNSGGTDNVWFYNMETDGYSLDDKRDKIDDDDIPDVIAKWKERATTDLSDRKAKCFMVPVDEIRENDYDLSINRYKEIEYEEVEYDPPEVIIQQLRQLEQEIASDLDELEAMLG